MRKLLKGDTLNTVGTTPTVIISDSPFSSVYLANLHATNTLSVGINEEPVAGKQIVLPPGAFIREKLRGTSIQLKGSGANTSVAYALFG